jgi:hypothetical protein
VRGFQKSAQAAQARHQRARTSPLPPGRSESVVRGFQKSAQAAQARHQRARNSPLPPGRSEPVVRGFQKSAQAAQARHQRARNSPLPPGRSESVVRGSKRAHRPRRHGTNGRGTRPYHRAEASPLCAVPQSTLARWPSIDAADTPAFHATPGRQYASHMAPVPGFTGILLPCDTPSDSDRFVCRRSGAPGCGSPGLHRLRTRAGEYHIPVILRPPSRARISHKSLKKAVLYGITDLRNKQLPSNGERLLL